MRSIKSWSGLAVLGICAASLVLVAPPTRFEPRLENVGLTELEEIQGLSQWRNIFSTQSCSEYNASIANDPSQPPIPGQPPGKIIPVDSCPAQGTCLECDGNGTQFTGAVVQNGAAGSGMTVVASVSCGNLYFGTCMANGVGGWTCNNDGMPDATCGDATEFHNQPVLPAPGPA